MNNVRDVEERITSGQPFQTKFAAAENDQQPMVARLVGEMTITSTTFV